MTEHNIEMVVNGVPCTVKAESNKTLLWVLRNKLRLTGAKPACERGDCGLCTVLLDDQPVKSCIILAVEAHRHRITTIEGITRDNVLTPLQTKFIEHGAIQCGFCTPAAILAATALLKKEPSPTREEVVEAMEAVLCRCTGYRQMIDAILDASKLKQ